MTCTTADLIAGLREHAQRLDTAAAQKRVSASYCDDARVFLAEVGAANSLAGDASILGTAAHILERGQ